MTNLVKTTICAKHPELAGLRYASGRNCPKCNAEWARDPARIAKRNAKRREWYARNSKREISKQQKYYEANRSTILKKQKERYRSNADVIRAKARVSQRRAKYGLPDEALSQLFATQSGGCAICRCALEISRLCVDHDHVTGKVRGLLCSPCNKALGFFRDDTARLRAAISYLRRNESD